MSHMTFLMVLHSHQPVGNFHEVFEKAVRVCYRPVLETFEKYPGFRLGLHYTGPLLAWLERHDPELLDLIRRLAARGQVELLTGGHYEPLLASIPHWDALGQLKRHAAYTRECFDQKPTGFWLAERIWEPGLPAKIGPADLAYTIVDDTHLYYAGLDADAMFGYHLTEREGHALALFPCHKDLRYAIPFREPVETLDFLRRALDKLGPTSATYGDDCEKFGLWPETYEWVFEKGWLERFIEAVLDNGDWLVTATPGEYLAGNPSRGRVYLPTASYEEMLTWALPAEASEELELIIHQLEAEGRYEQMRRFLRGGQWDNFLVKYRESNLMHKRMLRISRKLHEHGVGGQALDHLYQAQCNCAYWHGMFGGLYLGHLRQAVHEHLIAAEDRADRQLKGPDPWARMRVEDVDMDGRDEVILAGPELDCWVHPAYGGSLSVLNLRRARVNLADSLTRRREAYHRHLKPQPELSRFVHVYERDETTGQAHQYEYEEHGVKSIHDRVEFKEEGLERFLVYDWYDRALFQDHLLAPEATFEGYQRPDYGEWGDLINQPFKLIGTVQDHPASVACRLARDTSLWAPGGPYPLRVEKRYTLGPGGLLVASYLVETGDEATPPCRLAVELNYTLLSPDDPARYLEVGGRRIAPGDPAQMPPVDACRLVSRPQGFTLDLDVSRPAELWHFPVQTVSQSESGLERTYQGSSLSLIWALPGGRQRFEVEVALTLSEA